MRVRLTPDAEFELTQAYRWYASTSLRAAEAFVDEFADLIAHLEERPLSFPTVEGEARRAGFKRFPYGLFFQVSAEEVRVFACFHASRDPQSRRR